MFVERFTSTLLMAGLHLRRTEHWEQRVASFVGGGDIVVFVAKGAPFVVKEHLLFMLNFVNLICCLPSVMKK